MSLLFGGAFMAHIGAAAHLPWEVGPRAQDRKRKCRGSSQLKPSPIFANRVAACFELHISGSKVRMPLPLLAARASTWAGADLN